MLRFNNWKSQELPLLICEIKGIYLLDELSTYINFTSYEDENGVFTVNVGRTVLVKGNDSYEMAFNQDAEPQK